MTRVSLSQDSTTAATPDDHAVSGSPETMRPMLATFEVGRLFNNAFFLLRQALLFANPHLLERLATTWDDLAIAVRAVVADAAAKDRIRDHVLQVKRDSLAEIESEWWSEEVYAAFRRLELEGSYPAELDDLDEALLPVFGIRTMRFRSMIENEMTSDQVRVFRFGEFVDQGARPPSIPREMFLPRPEPSVATEVRVESRSSARIVQGRPGAKKGSAARMGVSRSTEPPFDCRPHRWVEQAEGLPDPVWFRQLEQDWAGLGFRTEHFPFSGYSQLRSTDDWVGQVCQAVLRSLRKLRRTAPAKRRPKWDKASGELRVGTVVVKRYTGNARNQITLLDAFEEEGWPGHIDSLLAGADPKRQLNRTVADINKAMHPKLIKFRGDGTGEGVRWEFCE